MLSFKAILFNLLWTLFATAVLSQAAALPSSTERLHRRQDGNTTDVTDRNTTDTTDDGNTTDFTRPPQNCSGQESISSARFQRNPEGIISASKQSCLDLLKELQLGGRTSFIEGGVKGKISSDESCSIIWTSGDIDPNQVTFDDLVAPLAFAIERGSRSDGSTVGVIENYRLAGVCTNILVGISG